MKFQLFKLTPALNANTHIFKELPPQFANDKIPDALNGKAKTRDSNMELLRIVAMSMIIIHHFIRHGTPNEVLTIGDKIALGIVDTLCYIGVDLFFLISGYFGIKYASKSVIKLAVLVLFYGLLNIALLYLTSGTVSLTTLLETIVFPISGSGYWFIRIYFLLILTAPILNSGLNSLSERQLNIVIPVLVIAIAYMRGDYASYNYFNGMLFYCIGFYFKKRPIYKLFRIKNLIITYFVASLILAGFRISIPNFLFGRSVFEDYENIFIMTAAISVFLIFQKFSFKSNTINSIAASAIGCYLLQDGKFGFGFLYKFQQSYAIENGLNLHVIIIWICFFCGFWIAAVGLSKVNFLWMPQFVKYMDDLFKTLCRKLEKRLFDRSIN